MIKKWIFLWVTALCLLQMGCISGETYAPVVNAWHDPGAMKSRYRVQKGDTLYSIAWAFDLDYRDLARANHLLPPYALHGKQTLTMNVKNSTAVASPAKADSSEAITYAMPTAYNGYQETTPSHLITHHHSSASKKILVSELILPEIDLKTLKIMKQQGQVANSSAENSPGLDENKQTITLNNDKIITSSQLGRWKWPAKGRIVKSFSLQPGGSKGLDIAGHLGEPVCAAAAGKVVYCGAGLKGYGNLIIIKHNDTYLSAYAYNRKLLVKEGDWVKEGKEIAKMGQTTAREVLLHFEIRRNGKPVNPQNFIGESI
jgi:lipoprotein NlpD